MSDIKPRKIRQLTCAADMTLLEKRYTFLPPKSRQSWQNRMVQHYHSHLYKEFVLADLTRPGEIGLRWRTQNEVKSGKGSSTCGNKHCPSYLSDSSEKNNISLQKYLADVALPETEEEEVKKLRDIAYGLGLCDYEVPFTYKDKDCETSKTELVKLRLCLRCAPLIFRKREPFDCALEARYSREKVSEANGKAQVWKDIEGVYERKASSKWSSSANDERQRGRQKKRRRGRKVESDIKFRKFDF